MNRRFFARTALIVSILALGVAAGWGWSTVAAVKAQTSTISAPKPAAVTSASAAQPGATPPAKISRPQTAALQPVPTSPVVVPDDHRGYEPGDDHGSD